MHEGSFGVLIVDDEPNIRSGLEKGLAKEADRIAQAGNADEALDLFRKSPFPLVIVDIRLPSVMNGLELLERLLRSRPQTSVIVITAHGT
ncbi:MAG: response regulator, partial [Planctomycetaceae bacterium]|nr:response regulator [Planctomycetaceae bacterium]